MHLAYVNSVTLRERNNLLFYSVIILTVVRIQQNK